MAITSKKEMIEISWQIHDEVERQYLAHPANKSEIGWSEKQRLLLADMAIHLLQTALSSDEIDKEKLQNNLYSILTISDQYLPGRGLRELAKGIYDSS